MKKPLTDHGAKPMASIKAAAGFGDAVFTMLTDDAAVFDVVEQTGGLKDSLPKGGDSHLRRRDKRGGDRKAHSPPCRRGSDTDRYAGAWPAGNGRGRRLASMLVGGPEQQGGRTLAARCSPPSPQRLVNSGADPVSAKAAIKIANNFVLGCAIEAMGEGFALTRKYGVKSGAFSTMCSPKGCSPAVLTRPTAGSLPRSAMSRPASAR